MVREAFVLCLPFERGGMVVHPEGEPLPRHTDTHDELVSSGYYRVIPVSGMDKAEDYWGDCGEWNTVSVKDIREAIADVYSNYGMHLVRALQGAAWIENRWTNESSQQRLLEFMRSL